MKIGNIDWDEIESEDFESLENETPDLFEDYSFLDDEFDGFDDYIDDLEIDAYDEN